jgi:hypothetical protein
LTQKITHHTQKDSHVLPFAHIEIKCILYEFSCNKFSYYARIHSGKTWQNAFSKYIIKYVFLEEIHHFGKIKKLREKKREKKTVM